VARAVKALSKSFASTPALSKSFLAASIKAAFLY
tara:strand:- start:116 stop:217 length:102 start_codon:yes stop_codon:yes gene_type:complete